MFSFWHWTEWRAPVAKTFCILRVWTTQEKKTNLKTVEVKENKKLGEIVVGIIGWNV